VGFDLTQSGDEVLLRFEQSGFKDGCGCLGFCATKWGLYLMELKAILNPDRLGHFPWMCGTSGPVTISSTAKAPETRRRAASDSQG
jgi:hypothetical protein